MSIRLRLRNPVAVRPILLNPTGYGSKGLTQSCAKIKPKPEAWGRFRMQKKILLAVDGSTPSRQALDYAGRVNGLIQGLGVTLFHIQPPISQFLLDEATRSGQAQVELNKIAARNAEASRGLLAHYRDILIRAG